MTPQVFTDEDRAFLLTRLTVAAENAESPSMKRRTIKLMQTFCSDTPPGSDETLQQENLFLRKNLDKLKKNRDALKEKILELLAPPWHPAVFLGTATAEDRVAAVVSHGHSRRVVAFAEEELAAGLAVGDQVYLGENLNLLVGRAEDPFGEGGETAVFKRTAPDGRIVIETRDEEVVVRTADRLPRDELKSGDLVRWDRGLWMAFEKISRPSGTELFMEETPTETFADIGGLDEEIERLQGSILLHRDHPELVWKYGLEPLKGILMAGPPGTGKTMMARALANWLARLSPSGKARFMNIKPAALHSMWYSKAEEHYRQAFQTARRAGEQDPSTPVVMFFDEIDSCGGVRGTSLSSTNDRVLAAFLAELDGLSGRGNVLVVGATNRVGSLDSALLRPGRMGDCTLHLPRPGREAAREIFARHVAPEAPFQPVSTDGGDGDRAETLEAALARIYAVNGTGPVATLVFRDGQRREVLGRDLLSGSSIAKIVREAGERACKRELAGGAAGLCVEDFYVAIDDEIEAAAAVLAPGNCRNHLDGLPQDVDVVSVEPVKRTVARTYRVLRVA